MAQKVFNIIIKLLKEGGADKETVSGLVDIKNTLVTGAAIAGTFAVAYKTIDKVLDETVGKFTEYAKGVDVFSSALDTSVEEASKLIQVADDFGISADEMQKSMFRAVKEGMEPSIAGLAGMADEYNALATPQEKADFLVKNFGKSSQDLTRLLGEGSQAIKDRAAAIEGSLVLDQAAIDSAYKYEMALDQWNDSITAAKTSLGQEFLPVLQAGIDYMNKSVELTQQQDHALVLLTDAYRDGRITLDDYNAGVEKLGLSSEYLKGQLQFGKDALGDYSREMRDETTPATEDLTTDTEALTKANKELFDTIGNLQSIYDTFAEKHDTLSTKIETLKGQIAEATTKYGENSTKVQDLQGDLDGLEGELDEAAAKFEDESKRAILEMMKQTAYASGNFGPEMAAALTQLGVDWGIYSQGVVNQAGLINDALAHIGLAPLADIQKYMEFVIAHPNTTITFDFFENHHITYDSQGTVIATTANMPGLNPQNVAQPMPADVAAAAAAAAALVAGQAAVTAAGGQQFGGQILPNSYIYNENPATRPEVFVGGGGGYVLTKQDAMAALQALPNGRTWRDVGTPEQPPPRVGTPPPAQWLPREPNVTINLTYAPVMSLANEYELQQKLIPFIKRGLREAGVVVT